MSRHATRKLLATALFAAAVTLSLSVASGPARAAGGPFGLGIILGSPTGISGKLYLNQRNAIDFAIGGAFLNRRGLHVHADYLWHPIMLASDEAFFLPLYFGVGARILSHKHGKDDDDDDLHLGVRIPGGIVFDFKRVPMDVFLEVALIVDLIQDDDDLLDLNAGIGVRYYF